MKDRTNQEWLDDLRGPDHDEALADLRAFLVRGLGYSLANRSDVDGDTAERLRRRTDYIIGKGVDVMQTTYLTPLPGTRLFDQLQAEGRLLYTEFPRDWDRYDMTEVVHQPGSMTPAELAQAMHESNQRMYGRSVLLPKALRTLWQTRSTAGMMLAWRSNMNYRNVATRRQSF